MLGGAVEKRYRRMRPEVESMPWGTLDLSGVPEHERVRARPAWMATEPYLELAARSMNENVLQPLRERGIPVSRLPNGA
jgi:hypothetical protein